MPHSTDLCDLVHRECMQLTLGVVDVVLEAAVGVLPPLNDLGGVELVVEGGLRVDLGAHLMGLRGCRGVSGGARGREKARRRGNSPRHSRARPQRGSLAAGCLCSLPP